jgi:glutamate synthase domain-containing protein 3/ferredoxin
VTIAIEKPPLPTLGASDASPDQLRDWEDMLVLLVDPENPAVTERERKRRLLSFLLERAEIDEERFWNLSRGQRGRLFLSRYSRQSRDIPQLELTSFDLDKVHKERFRHDPLTLGAAWHFGFWRTYFSHAAITHPANDGLREEFSTAWVIARREPAVLHRYADHLKLNRIRLLRLDMPMIVGPLPHSDGQTLERAYLRAIERANPEADVKTRSLVVVPGDALLEHGALYLPHAPHVMPRLEPRHLELLEERPELAELLGRVRMIELEWNADFPAQVESLRARFPESLFSVHLHYGDGFWEALETAVRCDRVAMVQVHSGAEKSYRLISRVDAHLKKRFLRARVQLVSAGGDTDTHASAATVYESVLLGSNGGAMTHLATLALVPELVDVYHGAPAAPVHASYAQRDPEELERQAQNTLTCWQHSILDFLSCMGIDDIHKTSGNAMAITITDDWMREVDQLVTPEFAVRNRELNRHRVEAEPVPEEVRARYEISSLLDELHTEPLAHSARILAQEAASWHLMNTNRNLTADFLEIIYRMSAGELPTADDFFVTGDMGLGSIDEVQVVLSRESLAWSIERLKRDPTSLDYVSLAVARGFDRPGAVRAKSTGELVGANGASLARFEADATGAFDVALDEIEGLDDGRPLTLRSPDGEVALVATDHGAHGLTVVRASQDGATVLKRDPRGGLRLVGLGIREPIWQSPVSHASISLGAASEDFLTARIQGNAGLSFTSSGEGGPLRLPQEHMTWETLQAASGHFGLHGADLRRVRDVEIKINQGAKPGKGGRLSGAKVTPQVSRARNIPVGTNALSPDPKHDIYSIEDMPAEVWLWLHFKNHCGIKITGSNYTKFVAAGMWSNFVVDYLLIDSGIGGSGNYHADSSHVGWPDIFRTILHTHHALVHELVDLTGSGELRPIRDQNGVPFGAKGGTRLFASGGLRGELDMLKVLIAGADGVVEASIGKAVAFGCNQCGNCHLDCPRGGITTKQELTLQNERDVMRRRFRNWTVLNLVKLAVMIDALNRESGALDANGDVVDEERMIRDVRELRGRVDLLEMPVHAPRPAEEKAPEADHDSCRVGSLAVSEPVSVHAIWEAARLSHNGGNNRGGGIDFAGFTPPALREKTCLMFNTIGPDRVDTMRAMLGHLDGCRLFDAELRKLPVEDVKQRLDEFRIPVRAECEGDEGWRAAGLREAPGNYYMFFVEPRPEVLRRYGAKLITSEHWLQRSTKYPDVSDDELRAALEDSPSHAATGATMEAKKASFDRLSAFVIDVREEYFSALAHVLDTRFYRTHAEPGAPEGKYAAKRRGYLVSMGEDLGAIKISGWTHVIPQYFDFDRFWAEYPGAKDRGGVAVTLRGQQRRSTRLHGHVWGMHHRYPTNSPAIDAEGRGNPAGAHPFKSYNLLLMHNGEQVAVDSTAPFLCEYGYVHADDTMGPGAADYEGDSLYERKALTDTEYAAYLVDFTRRVLGLTTEEASQIISPITGIDLEAMDVDQREKLRLLMNNYVQLTPTGPYKFTIVESFLRGGERVVGFRENMDIKFLRPHEIISHRDKSPGGAEAVANGSEAKIADSMLRVLRQQGVLKDAAADLRFNMRQGGKPGLEEHGGVFEATAVPGQAELELVNRFGEEVPVKRAGTRVDLSVPLVQVERLAELEWMQLVDELIEGMAAASVAGGTYGPEDELSGAADELIDATLQRARDVSFHDYRYLTELALPRYALLGDVERALALRVLTELRKRLTFTHLGNKALSSIEYLTDGGRDPDDMAEGGIFRVLDATPLIGRAWGKSRHVRIGADTRDDLIGPAEAARDVLVVNLSGFESESFTLESCSRFLAEAVRLGWRNLVGYDSRGGPRYIASNFADEHSAPAKGVTLELYGREVGDFVGALLEGARVYTYGQAQSHVGFKADSGYMFVLQDALNTCMYSAHGGTISAWDTGSRFAVAGQNKVYQADDVTLAQGFKSIHFGSPNEYAFEYLMSGGENSMHVVMGLKKPDARGELALRPKPYAGKFLMSGAAAGRVFLFDPDGHLDPAQHVGNVPGEITPDEWSAQLGPFIADEARRRGAPIRIDGESISVRLLGNWRTYHFTKAFLKLVPAHAASTAAPAKG